MTRIAIEMPSLGYDMESGAISSWLKNVGDKVARGEAIAEIETDKTTVEMESTADGILAEIVVAAGTDVRVGAVIGYLDDGD